MITVGRVSPSSSLAEEAADARSPHQRSSDEMGWLPPSPDGIAMCQNSGVETYCKRAGTPEPVIVRYFLLSTLLSPERMLEVARTHWTIENQLHWVLDVALLEDAARARKDNAPQNLAIIRKLALNTLRQHPAKGSIKTKIKRAGWNDDFLASLLGHVR
ncbi:ISAs1 family transposase [Sphingomonas populi]|uniref:ISAs1 family transposase n=2 Tax=Sphingomonas populi TaxID=2484750 RepID=A0A4Q6XS70_9SPHN|nr:ISAs1 family transposase [Sphingomonas populi]